MSKTSELSHLFRALKAPSAARALPAPEVGQIARAGSDRCMPFNGSFAVVRFGKPAAVLRNEFVR
jgi:hypothetical protein